MMRIFLVSHDVNADVLLMPIKAHNRQHRAAYDLRCCRRNIVVGIKKGIEPSVATNSQRRIIEIEDMMAARAVVFKSRQDGAIVLIPTLNSYARQFQNENLLQFSQNEQLDIIHSTLLLLYLSVFY